MEHSVNRAWHKRNRGAAEGVGSTGVDGGEPTAGAESAMLPEHKPVRDPISAVALKLERKRDATQAMQDHEAARLVTLAKTARLRSERLARDAEAACAPKRPVAPKKAK
jgi:hypothetical protein